MKNGLKMKIIFFCFLFYFPVIINLFAMDKEIEDYYDKAVEYEALERNDEASEMYLKILEKEPQNTSALFDLANLYFQIGKIDESLQAFQKILKMNPSHAKALSRVGLIYIQKNDYPQAIDYLNKAQEANPELAEVQINFSKFYYVQRLYKQALVYGKKAILQDSNSNEAYLVSGLAYSKTKEYRDAIKQFVNVIEIELNSFHTKIAIKELDEILSIIEKATLKAKEGTTFYDNKKYDEAKKIFKEVLEDDPYNVEASEGIAKIFSFVEQNNDEAIKLFKEIILHNPNYPYGYSGLAAVYVMNEDIDNVRFVTNRLKIMNINQKIFQGEVERLKLFKEKITDEEKNNFQVLLKAYDYIEYDEAYAKVKKVFNKLYKQEQANKFYQEGNKYLENKQYKEALHQYKTALQLYPNSKKMKEKWITTLRELRNTISKKVNAPEAHYVIANTLKNVEKFDEAEKEYSAAIDLDPNFPDAGAAHYWLGFIYEKQGRLELAKQKFELVINKYFDYLKNNYLLLDAYWKLGNIYNRLNDYEKAIAILEKAIERDSRWEYLYVDLASVYVNKKFFVPAIEQIKLVLKRSPGHNLAENKLREIYTKMGYSESEIQKQFKEIYFQIIVQLENEKRSNNYSKDFSLLLGKAYVAVDEYGKAINEFNIYLDKFPGDNKVESQLLSIYSRLNYTPTEISQLELKLKKSFLAEEYYKKGNEFYEKNKYNEAIERFENAIKIRKNFIKAIIKLGDSYVNLKKLDLAIKEYKNVLEIDPNLFEVYSGMSYVFNIQGLYDQAIESATKAININPYFANAYNNLGFAYMKKKMYQEAIKEFEKAVELLPDYSVAIRNLDKCKKQVTNAK